MIMKIKMLLKEEISTFSLLQRLNPTEKKKMGIKYEDIEKIMEKEGIFHE